MDFESSSPDHADAYTPAHLAAGRRSHAAAALEEQLLGYGENTENEGEDLEEEVLQVREARVS